MRVGEGGRRRRRGVWALLGGAVVVTVVAVSGSWAAPDAVAAADPLVDDRAGVVVDWRRGVLEATAGAAADHRMPSAEVARPGAERRARAAARARLADGLRGLPLGGGRHLDEAAVSRALDRARVASVEYQSNGGALVRLQVPFGAWSQPSAGVNADGAGGTGARDAGAGPPGSDAAVMGAGVPPPAGDGLTIALPEGHLAAAPLVVVGGREVAVSSARYVTAAEAPPGSRPVPARADKKGRLLVGDGVRASADQRDDLSAELAGRPVVVYVHKILR